MEDHQLHWLDFVNLKDTYYEQQCLKFLGPVVWSKPFGTRFVPQTILIDLSDLSDCLSEFHFGFLPTEVSYNFHVSSFPFVK